MIEILAVKALVILGQQEEHLLVCEPCRDGDQGLMKEDRTGRHRPLGCGKSSRLEAEFHRLRRLALMSNDDFRQLSQGEQDRIHIEIGLAMVGREMVGTKRRSIKGWPQR